jgi:hypothetical protein
MLIKENYSSYINIINRFHVITTTRDRCIFVWKMKSSAVGSVLDISFKLCDREDTGLILGLILVDLHAFLLKPICFICATIREFRFVNNFFNNDKELHDLDTLSIKKTTYNSIMPHNICGNFNETTSYLHTIKFHTSWIIYSIKSVKICVC